MLSLIFAVSDALTLPISGLDIAIGLLLAYSLVRGLTKGFIVEIAGLIAIVVGIYGAIHFSYFVVDLLQDYINWDGSYVNITALVLTFILIVLAISILAKVFTKLAKLMALNMLNRLLGGLFGLIKMSVILSFLLMIFQSFNTHHQFLDKSTTDTSLFYYPLETVGQKVLPSVLDEINAHKTWSIPLENNDNTP